MYTGWADTPGVQSSMPGFYERTKNMLRNDYEGSDTIVWLACCTKPAVQEASGKFYFDREEAEYVCWRLLEPPLHYCCRSPRPRSGATSPEPSRSPLERTWNAFGTSAVACPTGSRAPPT